MANTDEAVTKLCEVMRAQFGAGAEFELSLGDLVGRYRVAHERRMRDAQAAELLPLGAEVVVQRQGCHRSTVYRRVSRANKVARQIPNATSG